MNFKPFCLPPPIFFSDYQQKFGVPKKERKKRKSLDPPVKFLSSWQILNPVNNVAILAPALVGDQIEMVVNQFFNTFLHTNAVTSGKSSHM